ncbi:hypothetical protein [Niastella sp. OAS944]|uniref:hypothetical protein n=1 Tax=Niastella sp. OAS944 TaxID=2664089 RepID=UPI0034910368|nr:hypothetical protein [Chitinophagaceae bacterium OAS944]
MKNCKNLLFLLLLAACSSDPKQKAAGAPTVQANDTVQEQKTDTGSVIKAKAVVMPQDNLDTTLAAFLYKNHKNFDPSAQFFEYMQWDLRHEKIKPLLEKLYLKGQDKHPVLTILEQNRQAFHDKAVIAVLDGYKRGNGLNGVAFGYLLMKNDEAILPLIQDVLNNPKAPAKEKEYALSLLKKWKGGAHAGR